MLSSSGYAWFAMRLTLRVSSFVAVAVAVVVACGGSYETSSEGAGDSGVDTHDSAGLADSSASSTYGDAGDGSTSMRGPDGAPGNDATLVRDNLPAVRFDPFARGYTVDSTDFYYSYEATNELGQTSRSIMRVPFDGSSSQVLTTSTTADSLYRYGSYLYASFRWQLQALPADKFSDGAWQAVTSDWLPPSSFVGTVGDRVYALQEDKILPIVLGNAAVGPPVATASAAFNQHAGPQVALGNEKVFWVEKTGDRDEIRYVDSAQQAKSTGVFIPSGVYGSISFVSDELFFFVPWGKDNLIRLDPHKAGSAPEVLGPTPAWAASNLTFTKGDAFYSVVRADNNRSELVRFSGSKPTSIEHVAWLPSFVEALFPVSDVLFIVTRTRSFTAEAGSAESLAVWKLPLR